MKKESADGVLVRQTPLTESEWLALLEERVRTVRPHLRDMPLKALNDLYMLHPPNRRRTLGSTPVSYQTNDNKLSPDTKGIFPSDATGTVGKATYTYPEGGGPAAGAIHRFWGLNRDGAWMSISVETVFETTDRNHRIERVYSMTLQYTTLPELLSFCGVTVQEIWDRLSEVTREFVIYRESLLRKAKSLADSFAFTDAILNIVPRPKRK